MPKGPSLTHGGLGSCEAGAGMLLLTTGHPPATVSVVDKETTMGVELVSMMMVSTTSGVDVTMGVDVTTKELVTTTTESEVETETDDDVADVVKGPGTGISAGGGAGVAAAGVWQEYTLALVSATQLPHTPAPGWSATQRLSHWASATMVYSNAPSLAQRQCVEKTAA